MAVAPRKHPGARACHQGHPLKTGGAPVLQCQFPRGTPKRDCGALVRNEFLARQARTFVTTSETTASATRSSPVHLFIQRGHVGMLSANRVFAFKPTVLPGYEPHFSNSARLYAQAFAAAYLLRRIDPRNYWHLRFKVAALTCPATEVSALGALPNWDQDPFWSDRELSRIASKAIPPPAKGTP